MKTVLLLALPYLLYAISGVAADLPTNEELLSDMIADGCAAPIMDVPLPPMPSSCMAQFFGDDEITYTLLPKRVQDWGSNGLGGMPWEFDHASCNQFFINLHQEIAAGQIGVQLTPHDLFHGHLIAYGPSGREHLGVVLHAKEYPFDLEYIKNLYQEPGERFYSFNEDFIHRNFLYLSHYQGAPGTNIYRISNQGPCARMFSNAADFTLSESRVAQSLENGLRLGDVNMFLADAISRIKYNFHSGFDYVTDEVIADYEAVETGKSVETRRIANQLIDSLVEYLSGRPLLYFMTGR